MCVSESGRESVEEWERVCIREGESVCVCMCVCTCAMDGRKSVCE